MKNLFTLDVNTGAHGCDEFLIRKSEDTLKLQLDESVKSVDSTIAKILKPLIIISFITFVCGIVFTGIFFEGCRNKNFAQAYSTVGWMLYVGIATLVPAVILFAAAIIWMRKFMANPQTQSRFEEQNELVSKIASGLGIPENCAKIDVLCRPYKLKNGKEHYQGKQYENFSMWVFTENDNLCFADVSGVWAFPISSITSVTLFPGHTKLTTWNKEENVNSPKYKREVRFYNGDYFVKGYYSLQLERQGEEWEVLIPVYDIEPICELTGKDPDQLT